MDFGGGSIRVIFCLLRTGGRRKGNGLRFQLSEGGRPRSPSLGRGFGEGCLDQWQMESESRLDVVVTTRVFVSRAMRRGSFRRLGEFSIQVALTKSIFLIADGLHLVR